MLKRVNDQTILPSVYPAGVNFKRWLQYSSSKASLKPQDAAAGTYSWEALTVSVVDTVVFTGQITER